MFDLASAGLLESPLPQIAGLPAAAESAAAQLPAAGVKRHPAGWMPLDGSASAAVETALICSSEQMPEDAPARA